jgi:choline dehydrogenase
LNQDDNLYFDLTGDDATNNQTFIAWTNELWSANKTGPNSLAAGNAVAWLSLPVIAPSTWEAISKSYETQDPAAYLPVGTDPSIIEGYKLQQKLLAAGLRSNNTSVYQFYINGRFAVNTGITLLQQMSRGNVFINTTDPSNSGPLINYRAFTNPTDMDIFVELVRFTAKYYLETAAMKELKPRITSPFTNVTEIAAWARANANPTEAHPIGTCSMMPRELGGVVGQDLLVYGVSKLSIVDASVQPIIIGAPTVQTVYVVAEKVRLPYFWVQSKFTDRCRPLIS